MTKMCLYLSMPWRASRYLSSISRVEREFLIVLGSSGSPKSQWTTPIGVKVTGSRFISYQVP